MSIGGRKSRWIHDQYWTLFQYGESTSICSKHRTWPAALQAAAKCEKRGGAKHIIVRVTEMPGVER